MALGTPNAEDRGKLHAEVNQYINQQFTISMAAITIFGIVVGWSASSLASSSAIEPVVRPVAFLTALILQVILMVLFVHCRVLHGSINVLAAYLRVSGASAWEADYHRFEARFPGNMRQQVSQCVLFGTLGTIAGLLPFFFLCLFPTQPGTNLGVLCTLVVLFTAVYLSVVVAASWDKCLRFCTTESAERQWRVLHSERNAEPGDPADTGRTSASGDV